MYVTNIPYQGGPTRPSWDPLTVHMAILGDASIHTSAREGTEYIYDHGAREEFHEDELGNHMYKAYFERGQEGNATWMIDNLLCKLPGQPYTPPARTPAGRGHSAAAAPPPAMHDRLVDYGLRRPDRPR